MRRSASRRRRWCTASRICSTASDELQSEYQAPVLVEQYIEGREFYVGVLGNANADGAAGDRDGLHRLSRPTGRGSRAGRRSGATTARDRARSSRARSRSFPTDLDPELEERMQKVAVEAFHALRLRDYARIDLRVSPAGEIYVIEVNPNCYLERESEFARAAKAERAGVRGADRADRGAGDGAVLALTRLRRDAKKEAGAKRRLLFYCKRRRTSGGWSSWRPCGQPSWRLFLRAALLRRLLPPFLAPFFAAIGYLH